MSDQPGPSESPKPGPARSGLRRELAAIARAAAKANAAPLDQAAPKRRRADRTTSKPSGPKISGWTDGLGAVRAWFAVRGWAPWPFQEQAWAAHRDGRGGLITVATGAGKTYAAYGGPLSELIDESMAMRRNVESPEAGSQPLVTGAVSGLRVLYVTPLRAVSRDTELALLDPVQALGLPLTVESRTGDTKASVRQKQRDRLPNVLITTPESLTLLLTRENAAELFAGLRAVIVDEWHELIATKRGTQVELALARLRRVAPRMRAWALSATLPNLEVAARAIVGVEEEPVLIRADTERPIIVDSVLPGGAARLPWAGHLGLSMLPAVLDALDPSVPTILFANTRSQAERWFHALAVCRPQWSEWMALHHGSLEREERERVEGGLKSGSLRLVVATSSLDLGVDFAPIERVFQIGSPKGVARVAQRAGRASHRPRAACRITCVPTHALELIEIAAARAAIERGEIEEREPLPKPLDVLAQHLVTCALGGGFDPEELFEEIRTAWSYRDLTRQEFEWAIVLMRDGGEALGAYDAFRRIRSMDGRYRMPSAKLAALHRMNVGTITGDTSVEIRYVPARGGGRGLGRIEENFVSGLREGEKFVFAGKVLQFAYIRDLVAYVRPATGTTNYTPIWGGTRLPISESLAESIRRTLESASHGDMACPELVAAADLIRTQTRLSRIPGADETLIEIFRSREGSHLFIFPFAGRLVHGGLASIIALRLTRARPATFSVAVNDYGFELLCPDDFEYRPMLTDALFSPDDLVEDAIASVNISQLAKLQFREVARVANLVFQNYPGLRKAGKQTQASSSLLFDVLSEFDPGNLLLRQARREVLERNYEQSRLRRTLERLSLGPRRIVETSSPTPLGFPLMIERLAGRLSSESILDRVNRMQAAWTSDRSSTARRTTPLGTAPAGSDASAYEWEPAESSPSTRQPDPSARRRKGYAGP